ncbi:glycoside hydrolase family 16 protein [Pisolithus tinctorius]|nr:glycoside hydrolase family 16 protein [Pisolithus tinctorius]
MSPADASQNPKSGPFFLGEDPFKSSGSSPSDSRPSSGVDSMANPFQGSDSGVEYPPSPPHHRRYDSTASIPNRSKPSSASTVSEPVPRQNITIVDRTDAVPRSPSYYGNGHGLRPSRASSAIRLRESFAPPPSRPMTTFSTAPSVVNSLGPIKGKRIKSTLLEDTSKLEKPWLKEKDPYARVAYLLTYAVAFLGVIASAVKCYLGYKGVLVINPANLCMVLDEEFNSDTNTVFGSGGNWFREVELGGYGNGEFEMTTTSDNNSYVSNGYLYVTPTLTSDAIGMSNIFDGYTYNLTDCTYNLTNPESIPGGTNSTAFNLSAYYQACGAVSNSTAGTVIPPVQSARISTRYSASIRYGRVEVRAKLPRGDWLWPAIWMLPVNNTYGPWPMSGEIDIMESRGNGRDYPDQGIDYVRGSLNWGPLSFINAVYKTFGWWTQRRTDYGEAFHTYALEWTDQFIRIYVDSRLQYMLQLTFSEPFFSRGDFPAVVENGTTPIVLENPWVNGTNATPFDQPFYLILSLAAGGTNGWFPDNAGNKPWLDGSNTAMKDFALAQNTWYQTWGSDGESQSFIIDYVKMWQLC